MPLPATATSSPPSTGSAPPALTARHDLARNVAAPPSASAATISAPGSSGVVSVHAKDAAGNWGPYATINLTVDATGPTTSGLTADPSANNGSYGQSSGNPSVRISATSATPRPAARGSRQARASSTPPVANGTGFPFTATDGVVQRLD